MGDTNFTIVNIGALSRNKYWNETEAVRSASATCILLEVGGKRLIVDPSPKPEVLEPMLFARTGLRPRDIDSVFITHWHGDHRFGLGLFTDKTWIMASKGISEWKESKPEESDVAGRFLPAEDYLPDGVSLLPTPGHTWAHYSLIFTSPWGRVVAAGDAVMTFDFFKHEDGFHNSVDFSEVAETIRKIRDTADLVIPGHGNYFPVADR